MKVGDLVTKSRKHMSEDNLFYNSWLRVGIILVTQIANSDQWVTVMWASSITHEPSSGLEVISEI